VRGLVRSKVSNLAWPIDAIFSGNNFYIPFISKKNIAYDHDETTSAVLAKSDLPPTRIPEWAEKLEFKTKGI